MQHSNGATVELYQINDVPLTEINKTHTSISEIGIDSYVITTTTASDTDSIGGQNITATENAMIDGLQTLVPILNTQILRSLRKVVQQLVHHQVALNHLIVPCFECTE